MGDDRKLRPSVVTIVDAITRLSAGEAAALLAAVEERLGVSATPSTSYADDPFRFGTFNPPAMIVDVWIDAPGPQRIPLIALLRQRLALSMERTIEFCDRLPGNLGLDLSPDEGSRWLAELEEIRVNAKVIVVWTSNDTCPPM